MKIEFDIEGLNGVLETLRSLPSEVVSKRGGPVKLALAKGARLIRDEEKNRLAASIAINGDESTGLLMQNIVATRGKAPSDGKGERYLVRIRRKAYPDKKGSPVTTIKSAHIMEYGSERQVAQPFIRPAFQATAEEAIQTISDDLVARVDKIVTKLSKQNQGLK